MDASHWNVCLAVVLLLDSLILIGKGAPSKNTRFISTQTPTVDAVLVIVSSCGELQPATQTNTKLHTMTIRKKKELLGASKGHIDVVGGVVSHHHHHPRHHHICYC
jgi:hypothetical protein